MIDRQALLDAIPQAVTTIDLDWPYERTSGKVRESFVLPASAVIVTTVVVALRCWYSLRSVQRPKVLNSFCGFGSIAVRYHS